MRKLVARIALVASLTATATTEAYAGIGDVDAAYGQNGRVEGPMIPLPDGRALVPMGAGYGRLDAAGQPDPSFSSGGLQSWPSGFQPNWDAWLRMTDGSTLLGGSRHEASVVIRIDAEGRSDIAVSGGAILVLPPLIARSRVEDLALTEDGGVMVLTGEYYAALYWDTPAQVFVRRLDATLTLDTGYGQGGNALLGDYRTSAADFPYVDTYRREITALAAGYLRYDDDYEPSHPLPVITRHRYLDPLGRPVSSAGRISDPAFDAAITEWRHAAILPEGATFIDGFESASPASRYQVCRRDASGRSDPAFGNLGCLTLEGSMTVLDAISHVASGGHYLYVVRFGASDTLITRIVLHGATAGTIDHAFGAQGTVHLGFAVTGRAMQGTAEGSLLLQAGPGMLRLMPADAPSPGIVSFDVPHAYFGAGLYQARVSRSAGATGAVSVRYRTATALLSGLEATIPRVDFEPVQGELAWADGDTTDRLITIEVLPGFLLGPVTSYKAFDLVLELPQGGALLRLTQSRIYRTPGTWTVPTSPGTVTAPTDGLQPGPGGAPVPSVSVTPGAQPAGGGGAFGPVTLLALGLLAWISQQKSRRRRAPPSAACLEGH